MTRRKQGFAAKDRSSQCRVETWRRENRMIILRGMPFSTLPEEFEAACRARLSQHQSLQFEWEPSCHPWLMDRGRVALGFESAEMRAEAERRLEGWYWKAHPIKQVTKTRPSPAQTTKETATSHRPPSQLPPAAKTVDLTASSPRAPARSLAFRLLTPVNVPCAAATAVQEASCIAAEAAAAADAAVAEAHAATFRAFTAEAAGDVAAAASAQEEASAADERARSAYGAAASAARIASAYSSCISSRDDFYRY
ncbi:uncharacterized protein BBA_07375 [Beauveria bassiana ARSEF 2860]|uniref:Uncharacterized protein n=1 Tax=Beauveria bassiana (strain ARSEF 2860) TaxID=655819 RepID=J5JKK5_BEAB2|nr:uncharacterized protein BBA_07375 [Beauveria bassiana ARSEF 2860]EJP63731.1 hypothetical protein BBA_07375 [Beauveria bassiana ARSEF 2860]